MDFKAGRRKLWSSRWSVLMPMVNALYLCIICAYFAVIVVNIFVFALHITRMLEDNA